MAADLLEFFTDPKWLIELPRQLAKMRQRRRDELDQIANIFGDPEQLVPYYVHPDCTVLNPADEDEDDPLKYPDGPLFDYLEDYFMRRIEKRDGRRHLFLLADAGMGKTSALVMFWLASQNRFMPSEYQCRLAKLGPGTSAWISSVKSKRKTILLLDSLDEDAEFMGPQLEDRLERLINETANFHRVVITCRTQFFPGVMEKLGRVRIGNAYKCRALYLSPFTDRQVKMYLRKRFPTTPLQRALRREHPKYAPALEMAKSIRSLRSRPMLLSHIEDLMARELEHIDEFAVYQLLVEEWLQREERKSDKNRALYPNRPKLHYKALAHACFIVAIWLQGRGLRVIERDSLSALIAADPNVQHLEFVEVGGRSLLNRTSDGGFRFSHYSIQEFLVAYATLLRRIPLSAPKPRATSQLLQFIFSGLEFHNFNPEGASGTHVLDQLEWTHIRLDQLGFSRLMLNGVDLTSRTLSATELKGVHLCRARMSGVRMRGIDLSDGRLRGAELTGADLGNIRASGVDFRFATLRNADLSGALLMDAKLGGADLTGANLRNARLDHANLQSAILNDADLTGASLVSCSLGTLPSTGRQFAREQPTSLRGAILNRASLESIQWDWHQVTHEKLQALKSDTFSDMHTLWPTCDWG